LPIWRVNGPAPIKIPTAATCNGSPKNTPVSIANSSRLPRVDALTRARDRWELFLRCTRFLHELNAEKKMPLFFYLPMIVWMGMVAAARDEMRPAAVKAKRDP